MSDEIVISFGPLQDPCIYHSSMTVWIFLFCHSFIQSSLSLSLVHLLVGRNLCTYKNIFITPRRGKRRGEAAKNENTLNGDTVYPLKFAIRGQDLCFVVPRFVLLGVFLFTHRNHTQTYIHTHTANTTTFRFGNTQEKNSCFYRSVNDDDTIIIIPCRRTAIP